MLQDGDAVFRPKDLLRLRLLEVKKSVPDGVF
jgi:hypothetical protein